MGWRAAKSIGTMTALGSADWAPALRMPLTQCRLGFLIPMCMRSHAPGSRWRFNSGSRKIKLYSEGVLHGMRDVEEILN